MNPEEEWEVERASAVLLQPFCWLTLRITARDTGYAVATVSAGVVLEDKPCVTETETSKRTRVRMCVVEMMVSVRTSRPSRSPTGLSCSHVT